MKKIKYIFLLGATLIFFEGCLKNSTQTQGPQGPQGATGAPGGNLAKLYTYTTLTTTSFPLVKPYTYYWVFSGNPKVNYMLSVYVSKLSSMGQSTVWQKLPYPAIYTTNDVLSAALSRDTVKLTYNSSSPWPTDSAMNCTIILIPQPQ